MCTDGNDSFRRDVEINIEIILNIHNTGCIERIRLTSSDLL